MNYETKMDLATADEGAVDHERGESAEGSSSRKRLWVILAIVAALVLAAVLLTGGKETEPFTADRSGELATVTVLAPGSTTIEGRINATGTLAARREMPVGVVGEGGRVQSVLVEAGEWVRAGQVLAVIDRSVQTQQAAGQSAQIAVAQADADLAQANLDRALKLVERGFISQADIDRLTATRDAAVARVRVARAQLGERQARNAQLNIVAPAAGLVLERNVEPGQVVSPGSGVLFRLARGGEMEVLTQVGEGELAQIPLGATGKVTPVGSDKVLSCQVWQKAPVINRENRQGTVRCAMSYDEALRPGGFAMVELASGTINAPRLPESAILSDDEGSYVYIVDGKNTVQRRDVKVGMISDDGIAIASGLDGSERVVLRAGGFLNPGEQVRPVMNKAQ
ncbi:efflux RND transporter periplasmic adaptor subunit [Aurantiacibacter xanthus]|uniref:Efflux RND transporter periplasmic adaptor subunit n=1 Tax=Aurantiacibacter xanthus TaxID=1784712 RepID=A0A3A1P9D0_9SPHN|nr:efflux RND transporter periplasmic adaptor subunit [Aurantiacibacter xanthus]RIV90098.1 efflux RND transporter periplasmic adaptor subunit [Aurantiacibacter xanthus]